MAPGKKVSAKEKAAAKAEEADVVKSKEQEDREWEAAGIATPTIHVRCGWPFILASYWGLLKHQLLASAFAQTDSRQGSATNTNVDTVSSI